MRSQAANMFVKYLDSKGIKYDILNEDESIITSGWDLENASVRVYYAFSEDNVDVNITGMDFLKIPENKLDLMYKVCNEANFKYRWVKFYVNDDTVCASDDALIQLDSAASEVFDLTGSLISVIDDAYPMFMKALWG